MKRYALAWATLFAMCFLSGKLSAQGSETYGSGLTLKLNEDGSKSARFLTWHQVWFTAQENPSGDLQVTPMLRRSRVLMFARITPRFLINTHFGLNSLTAANMHPTGQSSQAQLFMHDAYAEYTVFPKKLYIGAGLHYYNGISRLSSQSTLNMMTLDAPRFNWATLGLSDQFARHLGVYAKGKLGKVDYRFAVNEAIQTTLDDGINPFVGQTLYQNNGGKVFSGYVNYQFWDQESNTLPYFVGSYVGTKRVLNIGAGFNVHPGGTRTLEADSSLSENDVMLFAADLFYDNPIGEKGAAITTYLAYYNYNFGPDYLLGGGSTVIGTGSILYGQFGFLTPKFSEKIKLQPYVLYSHRMLEAFSDPASTLGLGATGYLDGHNCKLTLEYQSSQNPGATGRNGRATLQAMIYL